MSKLTVDSVTTALSVISPALVKEFRLSFTQTTLLNGYTQCAVGASGLPVSMLSRKYGKRGVLLGSLAFVVAGTIWVPEAKSYNSLIGARVFQGLGLAMFESVTFSIVGDMVR